MKQTKEVYLMGNDVISRVELSAEDVETLKLAGRFIDRNGWHEDPGIPMLRKRYAAILDRLSPDLESD